MQVIYQSLIDSISSDQNGLGTDYGIDAALNDVPKNPYISVDRDTKITINLKSRGSYSGDVHFFMTYLAESATITFFNGENKIQETNYTNTYDLTDPILLFSRSIISNSIFELVPTNTTKITIRLQNTTDVQGDITKIAMDTTTKGKFLTSGDVVILHEDHPQIRLGSFVNDDNDNEKQINRITGDGSGSEDIQITPAYGDTGVKTISALYLPIHVNTIRLGKSFEIFNPKVGLSVNREDFSVIQERNSGLNYRLGEIRRVYSGSVHILESERSRILSVMEGIRAKPVAVKILDYQSETILFGSFLEIPQFSYSNAGSRLYDMSISFKELV